MHRKLLIILILFLFIKPVNAQTPASLGLSVSPQVFEMDVFPGETINKKIYLGNLSPVAIPIEVRLADFTAEEDSGEMLFDESDEDISFSSKKWFKVDNKNFILEPGQKKSIEFSIQVPKEAEPGGHYSVMLFEPLLPSFYFREGQPRNIPVIGSLFLLSVKTLSLEPEISQKLEVVEFSIPKKERLIGLENIFRAVSRSVSRGLASITSAYAQTSEIQITREAPSNFVLKIKNKDIYHIKPSGKILIYNFWGKRVGEAEIGQRTILPGKTREFPVEFSLAAAEKLKWLPTSISDFLNQNFFVGRYRAVLEVKETKQNLFFWSFPWKFWISFIFTICLFIFLAIKYRKRIKIALSTLFNPRD